MAMDSFWEGVSVFYERPGLINKRISGIRRELAFHIPKKSFSFKSLFDQIQTLNFNQIRNAFKSYEVENFSIEETHDCQLFLRTLMPKRSIHKTDAEAKSPSIEAVLVDHESFLIGFIPISNPNQLVPDVTYQFKITNDEIHIVEVAGDATWIKENVLPKIRKWSQKQKQLDNQIVCKSLQLINEYEYCILYDKLKVKYAPGLIDMWKTVETTDPLKFVYEDIAIASYLIRLWQEERDRVGLKKKQSFLDLGCGNGLLVHILNGEGHEGVGIDVRKRNVWDRYPEGVKLIEKTLMPCPEMLVGYDQDWLIGNHSDELTPWIPVAAARASEKMRVFVLPCCPFDFDGNKYQRKDGGISQYQSYMKYISRLCEGLKYVVKLDKLKIPSTKRICVVCEPRSDVKPTTKDVEKIIEEKMLNDVKIRSNVEEVRNCSKLPRDFLSSTINRIATIVIEKGDISLEKLSELLGAEIRSGMKNQFGGLQTLLRNHKYVFQITNGLVTFAKPKTVDEISADRRKVLKEKPCWFKSNHPDGCPLTSDKCCYKHE